MKRTKLLNFRPMIFLSIALSLGIISGRNFAMPKIFLAILSILLLVCLAILFLFFTENDNENRIVGEGNKTKFIVLAIFCSVFLVGLLTSYITINNYKKADENGHYYSVSGKVCEVEDKEYGKFIVIKKVNFNNKLSTKYKVEVFVIGDVDISLGDNITFESRLIDKSLVYNGSFSASYLAEKVKYSANIINSEITVVSSSPDIFMKANNYIKSQLKKGLGSEFATGFALLTGNSTFIEEQTLDNFRNAGVAHIFAVSGLHIGFLCVALKFLFDKLKINKYLEVFLIFVLCLFYSGICGFSSSSIRATIMCTVMLLAKFLGERYDNLSAVGISAFIVLLLFPIQLFCVGFQLSFGIILGIILLSKPIARIFKFLPLKFSNMLGSVLSAWIVSLPICLYAFKKVSTIAVVCNLVLLLFIGFVFITLLVCFIVSIFYIKALIVPMYILKVVNMCINAFDFKIFMVGGIFFGAFTVVYYLVLLFASDIINLKKITKTVACCSLSLVFLIGTVSLNVIDNRKTKIMITGSDTFSGVVIEKGNKNILIVSQTNRIFSLSMLKTIVNRENIDNFDIVIFGGNQAVDFQVFATRLNSVVSFSRFVYYGEKKENAEKILTSTFDGVIIENAKTTVQNNFLDITYQLNGDCITVSEENCKVAIFGRFENGKMDYKGLEDCMDLIVCYNYIEDIERENDTNRLVVFRDSDKYTSAEKVGYIKYKY